MQRDPPDEEATAVNTYARFGTFVIGGDTASYVDLVTAGPTIFLYDLELETGKSGRSSYRYYVVHVALAAVGGFAVLIGRVRLLSYEHLVALATGTSTCTLFDMHLLLGRPRR